MSSRESGLSRRKALTAGAGLVGAGALTAMIPIGAVAGDNEPAGPEGAWLVDAFDNTSNARTRVLYLVVKGGAVAATSDSPPTTGSTGFGAWERTGENQFRSTFRQFVFDTGGKLTGILRVRTVATIDKTTDLMTGQAVIDIQPPDQAQFTVVGRTHFTGTRIKVLPF